MEVVFKEPTNGKIKIRSLAGVHTIKVSKVMSFVLWMNLHKMFISLDFR